MANTFKEGIHYYFDKNGLMVMTEQYLSERGYCCKNGCKHCPYGYVKKKPFPIFKTEKKINKNT